MSSVITVELTLKDGSKLVLDKRKIKNIESLSQSNSDSSTIFYGVLASSGRLEILDYDGTIKRYIAEGVIDTSSIEVDIYTNGVLTQSHISSDSSYANENSIMTIELTNKLSLWDTINYGGYYYPEKPETSYEMLKNILISSGYEQDYIDTVMLSDYTVNSENVFVTIKEYLDSIKVEYPYLPADTLRATIDKFCTLAQLNVVLDKNGDIKFKNARPLLLNKNNIIQIPLSRQYGDFPHSVILKNKYDAVEIDKYNVVKTKDYDGIIGTFNSSINEYSVRFAGDEKRVDGIVGGTSVTYAYQRLTYYYGTRKLSRRENYNLKYIDKIYTGLNDSKKPHTQHTVNYLYSTGTYENYPFYDKTSDGSGTLAELDSNGEYKNISYTYADVTVANSPSTNLNNLPVSITDDYIDISFEVLAGRENYGSKYTEFSNPSIGGGTSSTYTSEAIKYEPKEVEISFYGDVSEISFEAISASSDNINSATNPTSIQTSELFSNKTAINGAEITEIVKANVLSDYSEGVSNGTITVAVTDYFDNSGNKVIDISKGQTITIGDTINIEGDSRYWRVTGANQRKTGTPYIDLEVMEVKPIKLKEYSMNINSTKSIVTINRVSSNNGNAKLGEITKEDILYAGDVIKFNVVADKSYKEAQLQSIKINSSETGEMIDYSNNSEYTVKSNVVIDAVSYSWVDIDTFESVTIPLQYSTDQSSMSFKQYASRIVADRNIRITGKPIYTTTSGYYPETQFEFYAVGNLDWEGGYSTINVMDNDSNSGVVIGTILFAIRKPTEDNYLSYENYSSVGANAYMSSLELTKIEQFM